MPRLSVSILLLLVVLAVLPGLPAQALQVTCSLHGTGNEPDAPPAVDHQKLLNTLHQATREFIQAKGLKPGAMQLDDGVIREYFQAIGQVLPAGTTMDDVAAAVALSSGETATYLKNTMGAILKEAYSHDSMKEELANLTAWGQDNLESAFTRMVLDAPDESSARDIKLVRTLLQATRKFMKQKGWKPGAMELSEAEIREYIDAMAARLPSDWSMESLSRGLELSNPMIVRYMEQTMGAIIRDSLRYESLRENVLAGVVRWGTENMDSAFTRLVAEAPDDTAARDAKILSSLFYSTRRFFQLHKLNGYGSRLSEDQIREYIQAVASKLPEGTDMEAVSRALGTASPHIARYLGRTLGSVLKQSLRFESLAKNELAGVIRWGLEHPESAFSQMVIDAPDGSPEDRARRVKNTSEAVSRMIRQMFGEDGKPEAVSSPPEPASSPAESASAPPEPASSPAEPAALCREHLRAIEDGAWKFLKDTGSLKLASLPYMVEYGYLKAVPVCPDGGVYTVEANQRDLVDLRGETGTYEDGTPFGEGKTGTEEEFTVRHVSGSADEPRPGGAGGTFESGSEFNGAAQQAIEQRRRMREERPRDEAGE